MSDLITFLRARLAEDEAAARAAPGERWSAFTEDDIAGASVYDEQWVLLNPAHYDHDEPMSADPGATGPQYIERSRDQLAAHIARHDPARVLREVDAKRAILSLHAGCGTGVGHCDDGGNPLDFGCHTLAYVGAIHSDHPDYRAEWAV